MTHHHAHSRGLTYALAQAAVGNQATGGVTTLAATLASSPTTGDLVVVCFGYDVSGVATCASTGATWTRVEDTGSGLSTRSVIFYSTNVTTTTITITWTGTSPCEMDVLHFTGNAASPFDVGGTGTAGGTATVDPGTFTLADSGELVVTHYYGNKSVSTPPSGYTALTARTSTSPENGRAAYTLTSGTSEHPTWGLSATTAFGAGCTAAFKHG